jgi:hypothetical protein
MSRVSFATTNWNKKPDKPEEISQGEWDGYHSSKFNGFPFPTPEKNQDNKEFKQWDGFTYFTLSDDRKIPSEFEDRLVSVLGDHYSYAFTFEQLFAFFWRLKKSKIKQFSLIEPDTVLNEFETSSYRKRNLEYVKEGNYGVNTFTLKTEEQEIKEETDLLNKLKTEELDKNENKWEISINFSKNQPSLPDIEEHCAGSCFCEGNYQHDEFGSGLAVEEVIQESGDCKLIIDFSQLVLKTGDDEYRPFFYCNCCYLSPCDDKLDCEKLTRFNDLHMGYVELYRQNDISDRPVADGGILQCLRNKCYEKCGDPERQGYQDCIDACNQKWYTNPSFSHSRKDLFKYYAGCVKFVKVKVRKNDEGEIKIEYINICGSTTSSGKDIINDILKPNVSDDTYNQPGCYLFKIEFYGYKAIFNDNSGRAWSGCDSKPNWISSDTGFKISLSTKIEYKQPA